MNAEFHKTDATLTSPARGRAAERSVVKAESTIYDDLSFSGKSTRGEAPPPIEYRDPPFQYSLLQLMIAVTVVALFFTLANVLGGIQYAIIVAYCLAQIGLHLYLKCIAPHSDGWGKYYSR